jgi:hypothetical protein
MVTIEAEHFAQSVRQGNQAWIRQTQLTGATGGGYMTLLPDIDAQTTEGTELRYIISITDPGTYHLWLRGYAPNAAGDSVTITLENMATLSVSGHSLSGFVPRNWAWANTPLSGTPATFEILEPGLYTLRLQSREDGLRLDRILLTTDGGYIPTGNGPPESDLLD